MTIPKNKMTEEEIESVKSHGYEIEGDVASKVEFKSLDAKDYIVYHGLSMKILNIFYY
jgi:hypothetical protein